MATVERFEDLEAWKHARELTRLVYAATGKGGLSRDFGLRDQLQRASVSVMANIAEGFESRTTGLFLELLGRAKGSAGEVRAHLYAALDAGYFNDDVFRGLMAEATETSRCISGLMAYLKDRSSRRPG
jgi:four helix bundle protein